MQIHSLCPCWMQSIFFLMDRARAIIREGRRGGRRGPGRVIVVVFMYTMLVSTYSLIKGNLCHVSRRRPCMHTWYACRVVFLLASVYDMRVFFFCLPSLCYTFISGRTWDVQFPRDVLFCKSYGMVPCSPYDHPLRIGTAVRILSCFVLTTTRSVWAKLMDLRR